MNGKGNDVNERLTVTSRHYRHSIGQPSSRYTSRYTHRFGGRIMTVRSVVPRVPSLVTGAGKEVGSSRETAYEPRNSAYDGSNQG